ncbi:aminoglycoside phosphotransferase family protein [Solirubrobacter soli]|uniref:aminoglycoside phosphotransferase family protein n=1 Tax=Solirubrobacter soli TaxID=363832 RepID=UPI0004260673|nr:aminoglycoside phosphotransferase family protein [Solirubrobacter soli]
MKLHPGEVDTSAALVSALVAGQFPSLAGPVREFRSTGTVNAIYRIGDELYARLPRIAKYERDLHREREWLPRLAPALSLRVPEPVAFGRPGEGYPFAWGIFRWLEGEPYAGLAAATAPAGPGEPPPARGEPPAARGEAPAARREAPPARGLVADERVAARHLARFVRELRAIPVPDDAPRGGRRPLRELDAVTRPVLDGAALEAWDRALDTPPFTGPPVWIHADLLRPNLLVRDGRLSAVIDFGGVGAGDPATDVIPAWAVFDAPGRAAFREALEVDDATWERARGIALHQAALIVPYYEQTNPAFSALARRTIEQLLD